MYPAGLPTPGRQRLGADVYGPGNIHLPFRSGSFGNIPLHLFRRFMVFHDLPVLYGFPQLVRHRSPLPCIGHALIAEFIG